MGTSKGYITPTTIHWSQAKRAVNSYAKNGDGNSRANAASKFATAMKRDIASSVSFTRAAGNILAFANTVSQGGIDNALKEFNKDDLIGKSSEEIFNELIQEFTNYGSTSEDYLSAEAIASALKELNISDMEQLKDIDAYILLKEMLIEYVKFSFAFRYEEQICMKRSPDETDKLLFEMNKYISNELHNRLELKDIQSVDFSKIHNSGIVDQALKEAYQVFEMFYEEA